MDVEMMMDALRRMALKDEELRQALIATRSSEHPLSDFCRIARERGCELYEMDILTAGEEALAAMKRSTNGGGENSPALAAMDDYYEMFIAGLSDGRTESGR